MKSNFPITFTDIIKVPRLGLAKNFPDDNQTLARRSTSPEI